MEKFYLIRTITSAQGTMGFLTNGDFNCKTLELPWRYNKQNISCIPAGEYICRIRKSPRFGITYHVKNVPNRGYILIHSGNFAGDKEKGFKSHVAGCILLGKRHGFLYDQRAVLSSRITVNKFLRYMKYDEFKLHIIGLG